MAGSRIERFSSIVKRCESLMQAGLMRKPLWYDVYVKHPPFLEPTIVREKPDIEIKEIFYAEDIKRAEKFNEMIRMRKEGNQSRYFQRRKDFAKHSVESTPTEPHQKVREKKSKINKDIFDLSDES